MFYATPTEGELDSFSTKENQFHLRGVQPPSAEDNAKPRLQALVSDILPSTTAVFSYAIGSRKLQQFLLVLKQ